MGSQDAQGCESTCSPNRHLEREGQLLVLNWASAPGYLHSVSHPLSAQLYHIGCPQQDRVHPSLNDSTQNQFLYNTTALSSISCELPRTDRASSCRREDAFLQSALIGENLHAECMLVHWALYLTR